MAIASPTSELTIRRADAADLDAVVELAGLALGWDDGPNLDLFRWKHLENPFGPSPMWLAECGGRLAGFRCLLRWELEDHDGAVHRAVRAVDTATHPEFQRRGIFTTLTMAAVETETAAATDLVFNTPNDQSRPGYLKMGWTEVGRLPVTVRPLSLGSLARMRAAKVPAAKWSLATSVGMPAAEALADSAVETLCAQLPRRAGLATPRRPDVLRWRYRLAPLHYRAVALGNDLAEGLGIFRLRRRGPAVECTVTDVLVPGADRRAERMLLATIARAVPADYLLRLGGSDPRAAMAPLRGAGPLLTTRALASDPPTTLDAWSFEMGDIELF